MGVMLTGQPVELAADGVPQELGSVEAQPVGPGLHLGSDLLVHPETQHRHTQIVARMTFDRPTPQPPLGTVVSLQRVRHDIAAYRRVPITDDEIALASLLAPVADLTDDTDWDELYGDGA